MPDWRDLAYQALESPDLERRSRALLEIAYNEDDLPRVEALLLQTLGDRHQEPGYRCLAATCLGHVARLHGALHDAPRVTATLAAYAEHPELGGTAADALGDIATFVRRA